MKRQLWFAGLVAVGLIGCGAPPEAQQPEAEQQPPAAEALPAPEALGESEGEIIGGAIAAAAQFPYQVRFVVNNQHWCGGTLVKPQWVVTAAHCVSGIPANAMLVVAGDNMLYNAEATEQVRTVAGYAIHPAYGSPGGAPVHDVAVVLLSSPMVLTYAVQTLALPANPAPQAFHTVSGWGQTAPGSGSSNLLKYANLYNHPVATCNGWLVRNLYPGYELCVGYYNGYEGGCHGDSGGPLALGGQLFGIVSWGRGGTCDSFTVFTDVYTYVPWIRSYVGW